MDKTVISTRHIRHDYGRWIDWQNQSSVMTLCGMKSRPGLCGIPGITPQPEIVERAGKRAWGWCMRCVRVYVVHVDGLELSENETTREILDLYRKGRAVVDRQYSYSQNVFTPMQ